MGAQMARPHAGQAHDLIIEFHQLLDEKQLWQLTDRRLELPQPDPPDAQHLATSTSKVPASLASLPPELLIQIAAFCTVPTILALSQTCRSIRIAVLDPSVFKNKLQDSNPHDSPDFNSWIDTIAHRAGTDPRFWARYALAHERAKTLPKPTALSRSGDMADALLWIPALAVTKHPFLTHPGWPWYARLSGAACEVSLSWLFVNLLMCLSPSPNFTPSQRNSWKSRPQDIWIRFRPQTRTDPLVYLRAVRAMIPDVRLIYATKKQFWCNVAQGIVPLLALPEVAKLPLVVEGGGLAPPLPFCEVGSETSWKAWFGDYGKAVAETDFLAPGVWQGYSTRLSADGGYASGKDSAIESSVVGVEFDLLPSVGCGQEFTVQGARDCFDYFELKGKVWFDGEVCRLEATKRYVDTASCWRWDCLVTPFGIVGFWGSSDAGEKDLARQGLVWLWKRDWTAG